MNDVLRAVSFYDNVGNRASLTDSLGGVNSYTYDVRDELTSLTQSGTGVAAKRVDFAYDAAGRRTSLTRYSNLSGTTTVLVTANTYDGANRLTNLTHETSLTGGTVVASYGYTLDDANRLTQEAHTWNSGASSDTLGYTYTNNDQLTAVTHTNGSFANESFSYDANGNRNSIGYSTSTGNRLSSDGTFNYSYDDEGNLTSKTAISTGNQTLYTWDYRNRLSEADQVVGGVRSVVATYTHDALDRRIGVSEGGAATWTMYDATRPVLDLNNSGTQTARYLNGPRPAGVDAVLARETSSGVVAWYLADRLGTVRDLVDNTGAAIDHIDYGSFGSLINESSPSSGDRFKFADLDYDAATGLYFATHRAEEPSLGRWTTEDPIGFAGSDSNLYRYIHNHPADSVDPYGLLDWGQLLRPTDLGGAIQAASDATDDVVDYLSNNITNIPYTDPVSTGVFLFFYYTGIDDPLDGWYPTCAVRGPKGPGAGGPTPPRGPGGWKPGVPIGDQLAGTGQLKDLRRNPNLKGINVEELLRKKPEELMQMLKDGIITQKTLKQFTKCFEGRDLGGRRGG
jgi:RHS repeat-associated protein